MKKQRPYSTKQLFIAIFRVAVMSSSFYVISFSVFSLTREMVFLHKAVSRRFEYDIKLHFPVCFHRKFEILAKSNLHFLQDRVIIH